MRKRVTVREVAGRPLTKKELEELLATTPHEPDAHIKATYLETWYVLPGDRLLVVMKDMKRRPGFLYDSRTEYLAMLEEVVAFNTQPNHVLDDVFLYGEDFPAHVPALVDRLAADLKIPRERLDCTVASLLLVDRAMQRLGPKRCMEPERFTMLVAYSGEVMRHATGGHWEMRYDAPTEVWEPWIVRPDGARLNPFLHLYNELFEGTRRTITATAPVAAQLGPPLGRPPAD